MASTAPSENVVEKLETPVTDPKPAKDAAKRVSKAPPGYKFVKVRKQDGSVVTVKRKLSPEELAASQSNSDETKTPQIVTKEITKSVPTSPTTSSSAASPPKSPINNVTEI